MALTVSPADIVIIGDLPKDKFNGVRDAIEVVGAEVRHLPSYWLDFNPTSRHLAPPIARRVLIKNAFSKLKTLLRARAERVIEALWDAVGQFIPLFTPECDHYFNACEY